MIDLSEVKVTGAMLLAWSKKTKRDPLNVDTLVIGDILYAYYLMAKGVKPEITEDEAYAEIESKDIMDVIKAFFPGLAGKTEDILPPKA